MTSVSEWVLKWWPCAFEFLSQLAEVVDLSVKYHPDRAIFVEYRLLSAGQDQ